MQSENRLTSAPEATDKTLSGGNPRSGEQMYMVRFEHLNGSSRVFGGTLCAWIDEFAGVIGRRYCGSNVITACIDNLNFLAAAYINDIILLKGRITYVGNTSMEVCVDAFVEHAPGQQNLINTAYLVMVALDENDKPCPVPKFEPQTEQEKTDWENGRRRTLLRKERRNAGL